MTAVVPVRLGERAYEVRIGEGLIATAGEHLRDIAAGPSLRRGRRDGRAPARPRALDAALAAAGLGRADDHRARRARRARASPAWSACASGCWRWASSARDLIVAFGGGVVGDLAGFAAAIYQARRRLSCRSRRRCWRRWTPRWAARRRSTRRAARTSSAPSTSRGWCWPTSACSPPCPPASAPAASPRCSRSRLALRRRLLRLAGGERRRRCSAGDPAALWPRPCAARWSSRRRSSPSDERERAGGARALLNLGHTFGHALEAESRLRRGAQARRGGGPRLRAGVPLLGATRACARRATRRAPRRRSPRPACRLVLPAGPRRRGPDRPHGRRTRRPAAARSTLILPRAHRRGLRRPAIATPAGARLPRRPRARRHDRGGRRPRAC